MGKATPVVPISRGTAGPCAVRDPMHVRTHLVWEPGDPTTARVVWRCGPHREVYGRTPMMHGGGKSDIRGACAELRGTGPPPRIRMAQKLVALKQSSPER